MKSFVAGSNEQNVRLSRFVESVAGKLPQGLLYKSFRNKRIKVNGKRAAPDYRLAVGDLIELYINDEFFTSPTKKAVVKSSSKPLSLKILYEDSNIAVVYKPAHILSHGDNTGDANIADSFVSRQIEKGEYDPNEEASFRPSVCNRLDRGTEGLVITAKNHTALSDMNAIIRNDLLVKRYLTITFGSVKPGIYTAYLKHFEKNNKSQISELPKEGYKTILTDIQPLEKSGPFTLNQIGLLTGRTHQIRAHLSFLGAPVLGDIKYGNIKINERTNTKTQALCAFSIMFKDIPEENSLSYLSGKEIKLESPGIIHQFNLLNS